jgi:hypothetical protein
MMIIDENLMCSFKILKPELEESKNDRNKKDKKF